jgi:NAD(P)H dehydrogenase (quinone)
MAPSNPKLLVTGAGGKLGKRIVEHLLASSAGSLVIGSRNPQTLPFPNLDRRRVDFDDPTSLDAAFKGVDRVLLISTDRIDVPGLRIRQHAAAVDAAKRAGVRHILYTSMLNPEGSFIPFAPDHLQTEQAIERSGLTFTILRVSWYAENLLGSLPGVLASGKWFTAAQNGRINYVPREDVARAAAAALASPGDGRQRLDLTGPEPLTIGQIAAIANELSGKAVEVVQVSDEQLADGLRSAGLPPFVIPLVVGTDQNMRAGKFDVASDAVRRLTGKAAQSVRDYLAAHRAAWAG